MPRTIERPSFAVRLALLLLVAGCGPTQFKLQHETSAVGLPRPSVVYIYDFAVDPSEVQLDPGGPAARFGALLAGPQSTQEEQVLAVGHQVADRMAADLVEKINAMGLTAQRANRGMTVPPDGVGVTGQFADIDQGNRLRRLAIGFRQGQSRVGAQVQLYEPTNGAARPLLEFIAAAESAPLPGAAVTMGAGAAVQVAAATAGAKELRDTVEADADHLAEKIASSLQSFFAKQGWTAPPSSVPELP